MAELSKATSCTHLKSFLKNPPLLLDFKCSLSKALPPLFLIEFYNPKNIYIQLFGKIRHPILYHMTHFVPRVMTNDILCHTIGNLIENKYLDIVSQNLSSAISK